MQNSVVPNDSIPWAVELSPTRLGYSKLIKAIPNLVHVSICLCGVAEHPLPTAKVSFSFFLLTLHILAALRNFLKLLKKEIIKYP